MLPYWGRISVRAARAAIALGALARLGITGAAAAYLLYSLAQLSDWRHKSAWRSWLTLAADLGFFAWLCFTAPAMWLALASGCFLLASAFLQDDPFQAALAVAGAVAVSLFVPRLTAVIAAAGAIAIVAALYQRYLRLRISALLRQNLTIRSHAQQARDAERERIAADFHDGPLQSFIGFQVRLEVVKKLLVRGDGAAAGEEIRQLQELGRGQVADLRSFARSMRPADEGLGVTESLVRLADSFQRDTGIAIDVRIGEIVEPAAATAQEILQIVREALHNISKHSGASRVTLSAVSEVRDNRALRISVQDNGSGFPFSGALDLDELDRQRLGPISIKRRVRLLDGKLRIESRPGEGAKLEIGVPV
ncbi:MAG TPA: histidine kinase [Bryobacteraceae bacterium]